MDAGCHDSDWPGSERSEDKIREARTERFDFLGGRSTSGKNREARIPSGALGRTGSYERRRLCNGAGAKGSDQVVA
jgi:hypothetical protein